MTNAAIIADVIDLLEAALRTRHTGAFSPEEISPVLDGLKNIDDRASQAGNARARLLLAGLLALSSPGCSLAPKLNTHLKRLVAEAMPS